MWKCGMCTHLRTEGEREGEESPWGTAGGLRTGS